ncbi:SMI1/KNR4 family protein [Nonomuraea sp. NN258]|uniref:SMI1/KNR4 family protein n=1 Tax=Nonomuraea antri TaxID=2730852 RepID=UPI0015690F11|nr:SMI1/KNR4 family protein [Nonomuraea antri]NRQ32484.1 SMI1/KNR4 family protein [Nonomuraea antri]
MSTQYAWSERFPERPTATEELDRLALNKECVLHLPAAEAEVRRLEERLGMELPASYRQFLLFANGWGNDDDCCLLRVEEIGWLREVDPSVAESWSAPKPEDSWSVPDELYFVYGREQVAGNMRAEYVDDTLLAGYWDDGAVLLNPHVKTPEGEWEAWYLAPWLAGARRYTSFWDLIVDQLRSSTDGVR